MRRAGAWLRCSRTPGFVTLESDNHILQEGEPAWDGVPRSEVRAFLGDDERARRHRRPTSPS